MSDPQQVLKVLRAAKDSIADERNWTNDGVLCDTTGRICALGAVGRALGISDEMLRDQGNGTYDSLEKQPAVIALAKASESNAADPTVAVYRANDRQHHADVLALFDKAIALVEGEWADSILATPNADAALEVMAACDTAGAVVARHIVRAHPRMDLREITTLVSGELFYAAQDTAQACELGVKVERV